MVKRSIDLSARLLRRAWRRNRSRKLHANQQQNALPILFANSFPKSGTHLLTQILSGFTQFAPFVNSGLNAIRSFEGQSGKARDAHKMAREIKQLLPGDISYGHVHAYPQMQKLLAAEGMAAFFIYRDPRDVVVSHVHYVSDINSRHVHHRYYQEELSTFEERLETSIRGLPDAQHPFPNISARFGPFMDWLNRDDIYSLRFEDLIDNREEAISKIIQFVVSRGFITDVPAKRMQEALSKSIDPKKSPTFRSGTSGAWKKQFSQQHKSIFKRLSGDLLIRLGYEKDQNW